MSKMTVSARRLLTASVCLLALLPAFAQNLQRQAMERVRTAPEGTYRIGEASADNEDDARAKAMSAFLNTMKTAFSIDKNLNASEDGRKLNVELRAKTAISLENVATLVYEDAGRWYCMMYVRDEEVRKAEEARRDNIKELINLGVEQEGKLNIAGALKYYSWALMMIKGYEDKIVMNLEGKERDARPWLDKHIPMILDNVEVSLLDEQIEYDESDYDHYTVNLGVCYAGHPVSALDLAYFNGEREVKPVHAKNGMATLRFPDLTVFSEISANVVFDYPEDGRNYDNELKAVYDANSRLSFAGSGRIAIPVKVKKDKIKATASAPKTAAAGNFAETAPIVQEERKTIERNTVDDARLADAMRAVEAGLRSKKYDTLKPLFTPEGWSIFELMTKSGEIRVTRTPQNYTVETSQLFTIGKGIPVSVKTGGHLSNENIVFRFDKSSGLIKSVAYALTERAENDIFRQANWNLESRYSLLTFMEDYQTAFALKRLDYIKSIFSDDAVIITGSFGNNEPSKRFYDMASLSADNRKVNYKRMDKDTYIKTLQTDFFDKKSQRYKKYIQLVFEDAVISKVSTGGFAKGRDVMWIEIKQQYNSDKYSDKGYLALQLDLRPEGSQIHVRTWTPQFIPIDELRERFNIGF